MSMTISDPFPRVWALGLPSFIWTQLERQLVTMLSRQFRSNFKLLIPHDIVRAEFTLPSMLVEALFQLVVLFIGCIANHKVGYLVKLLIPHDIIRAEFTLPPMLVEALFQLVVLFIGCIANHKVGYLVKLLSHLNHYMNPEILAICITLW